MTPDVFAAASVYNLIAAPAPGRRPSGDPEPSITATDQGRVDVVKGDVPSAQRFSATLTEDQLTDPMLREYQRTLGFLRRGHANDVVWMGPAPRRPIDERMRDDVRWFQRDFYPTRNAAGTLFPASVPVNGQLDVPTRQALDNFNQDGAAQASWVREPIPGDAGPVRPNPDNSTPQLPASAPPLPSTFLGAPIGLAALVLGAASAAGAAYAGRRRKGGPWAWALGGAILGAGIPITAHVVGDRLSAPRP